MGSATTPKTSEIYEPVANQFIVKGVAVSVQSLHGIQFPAHKRSSTSAACSLCSERFASSWIRSEAMAAFRDWRNFLFFLPWNSCAFLARFR